MSELYAKKNLKRCQPVETGYSDRKFFIRSMEFDKKTFPDKANTPKITSTSLDSLEKITL